MKFRTYIRQDKDGVFIATCPTLPGCISQGQTRAEARHTISEAISLYLDSLKHHGDPIPPGIQQETSEGPATLRLLHPEPYPPGNQQLSQQMDELVYGNQR